MQSKSKIAIGAAVVVGALALFFFNSSGKKAIPDLTGSYTHKDGSTAEFLSDGTAVFRSGSSQRIWKYTVYDSGTLKLETATPIMGVEPAMCNYRRTPDVFEVFGCEYAMLLQVRP